MIATKVATIYDVLLPSDVKELLAVFDTLVTLGLPLLDAPLACWGAAGYRGKLLFFFFSPILFLVVLFGVHLARVIVFDREVTHDLRVKRGNDSSANRKYAAFSVLVKRAVYTSLPPTTQILFVVYPIVTTIAFEAFSCYDLGAEGKWLIADVAIQCTSPYHASVSKLAMMAVLVYPVGLLISCSIVRTHSGPRTTEMIPSNARSSSVAPLWQLARTKIL